MYVNVHFMFVRVCIYGHDSVVQTMRNYTTCVPYARIANKTLWW